jgi:EAL domain-containing protein (putative c-di-GMP-specific phosphodiesterase class I)
MNNDISPKGVVIEITEGVLLKAKSNIDEKLCQLREANIEVAIDDFGTGYSSLAYLKRFDIDYLKLDKSFVSNLETDANDLALSEAIVVMAHKLGIRVVAEGVETEAQRAILKKIDCDFAQGYLFAKPMPADEFEVLLKNETNMINYA